MKFLIDKILMLMLMILLPLLLVSCEGSGGGGTGLPAATGTINIKLTDAATDKYQAVYVTINEVKVHHETQGWETLSSPELELPQTFDLLELVNGKMADLGMAELAAGHYNQMRLILEDKDEMPESQDINILGRSHPYFNYLIDADDMEIPLKVPSGGKTGIKLVNGFDIVASGATIGLILDFDAARSVVQAGKSGNWLLKPTIKVLETVDNSVSGVVDDGSQPIEGALVSAQVHDPDAPDAKDEVIVESTTVTTEEGYYKIFLPPDTYNVVATKEGYLPGCREVDAQYFEEYIAHFSLEAAAESFTISGTVSGLATDEDTALLSIRLLDVDCGGSANTTIEVGSVIVANGDYSITVPAGTYTLVASAAAETTLVFGDLKGDTELGIVFGL